MNRVAELKNVELTHRRGARSLPVSVVVPVKNEAENLTKCLKGLYDFDEVFVVDSQSNDSTAAVARSMGAKVVQFHYEGGWPKKRQWALDSFTFKNDWVLLLDADEVVTSTLATEIRHEIEDPKLDGYHVRLELNFLGRSLRHGDASFWKLSLFRKGRARFERRLEEQDSSMADMEVHEHVVVNGQCGKLMNALLHQNVHSLSRYIRKHDEYSNWESHVLLGGSASAEELRPNLLGTQAQRRRWLKRLLYRIPGSPVLLFLYRYLFRLGLLDGAPGLIYCAFQAVQMFHTKAKIYELKRNRACVE